MNFCYRMGNAVLVYGTLISPTQIQAVYNNRIMTFDLDFRNTPGRCAEGYVETEYYDVVLTGLLRGNLIYVWEIFDSPEESGVSVYRLFTHQPIKWAFVAEKDFFDPGEGLFSSVRTLSLFRSVNSSGSVYRDVDVGEGVLVSNIQTPVDNYTRRYPKLFVSKDECTEYRNSSNGCHTAWFHSFQLGA